MFEEIPVSMRSSESGFFNQHNSSTYFVFSVTIVCLLLLVVVRSNFVFGPNFWVESTSMLKLSGYSGVQLKC